MSSEQGARVQRNGVDEEHGPDERDGDAREMEDWDEILRQLDDDAAPEWDERPRKRAREWDRDQDAESVDDTNLDGDHGEVKPEAGKPSRSGDQPSKGQGSRTAEREPDPTPRGLCFYPRRLVYLSSFSFHTGLPW